MGWKGIPGFDSGIVQAPLGPHISGPKLVAAVANAGGIGPLRAALDWVLQVYWGEVERNLVLEAHHAGVKVVPQLVEMMLETLASTLSLLRLVASMKVVDSGVDAVIVQGREAGGHVIGQEGISSLLTRIVDL